MERRIRLIVAVLALCALSSAALGQRGFRRGFEPAADQPEDGLQGAVEGRRRGALPGEHRVVPEHEPAKLPTRLSDTGCFDTVSGVEAVTLFSYEVNMELWSDGAVKRRWFQLPEGGIPFGGDHLYPGPIFVDELEQRRPME